MRHLFCYIIVLKEKYIATKHLSFVVKLNSNIYVNINLSKSLVTLISACSFVLLLKSLIILHDKTNVQNLGY